MKPRFGGRCSALAVAGSLALASCGGTTAPRTQGTPIAVGDVDVWMTERVPTTQTLPTIVFLHGASFTADVWVRTGILDDVSEMGSRAVAVDLPGFGDTPETDLGRPSFLASLIATIEPDNGVVIVSPSMSGGFSLPLIGRDGAGSMLGFVPVAPVGIAEFADSLSQPVDGLETLIVWGADDDVVDPALGDVLATALPDHERVTIDDAGHAAYQDQPDRFVEALVSFVGDLPYSAGE
jgi:abhydrolase domain-containing protein 14